MSGIYFLFINSSLVYIGQSIDVERRLKTHSIAYHRSRVIQCPVDKLLHYEKRLINYFKPEMNGDTGGKRDGAGRKVGSYVNSKPKPTKVMRVALPLVEPVQEMIIRYYESLE